MRLFIAIELEEDVLEELSVIQSRLFTKINKGNFIADSNFHLTLHFLGETDKESASDLQKIIDKTAINNTAFTLSLDALGHFSKKQKEVIWVGVNGQSERLNELKRDLELKLRQGGLTEDTQEFIPHITLIRNAKLEEPFDSLQSCISVPNTVIAVKSLSLMESIRIDDKLVYRPIYVRNLSNIE